MRKCGASLFWGQVMATVTSIPIKPKSVTYEHEGQKLTCTYDPNAPIEKRWVWQVRYVETYHFFGSSPTLPNAVKAAKRKIHSLNECQVDDNE